MKLCYIVSTIIVLLFFALPSQTQTVGTFVQNAGIDDDMILDAEGNLYGSRFAGSNVYKITPEGDVSVYVSGFQNPNGLEFDTAGNLYVVDHGGNKVYKVLPNGEKSVFADYTKPSGIIKEFDSDTMIVTSYTTRSLAKLSLDGTLTPFVTDNSLLGPVGFAYDHNNQLYIANFDGRQIIKLSDSGELTPLTQLPGSQLGFICYRDSFLYATILGSHRIYEIDLEGNFNLLVGNGAGNTDGDVSVARFNAPNGIITSRGGDSLFISDFNTKSVRYIDFSNVVGVKELANESISAFSVSPNPAHDFAQATFTLTESTTINLELVDISGKMISPLLKNAAYLAGAHQFELDLSRLAAGTYFLRLTPENGLVAGRKLIVR